MGRRPFIFANNQFYHVFNRGVNKQSIFSEDADYVRFVHDLYEMNDANPTIDFRIAQMRFTEDGPPTTTGGPSSVNRPRELIVEILSWCLMPNHFHLMLRQKIDGGIPLFMKKLGTGYAVYFNKKYDRSGYVFQGRFKAVVVQKEGQFLHLSRYIHLNPVDLIESGWKEEGIKDWQKTHEFLENYRWSSYPDWIGKKNFSSVLDLKGVEGVFEGPDRYKRFMGEWAVGYYGKIKQAAAG